MPFRLNLPLAAVAALVAAGLAVGRRDAAGDPGVVRIVSSLPRSGSARGVTDGIVNGIRLAFEEADYRVDTTDPGTGEHRSFRLDYLDLDDATAAAGQWTIEQEIANANQARSDPDVVAYLGTYNSGAAKVAAPVLNRAGLLMVAPGSTAPALTKPRTGERHEPGCYRPTGEVNLLRVVPADDVQGAVAAGWAKDLGCRRVFVLDDGETYGRGVADLFRRTCGRPAVGIEVVGRESIDARAQEFKPLMQKVKGTNPDLVYFGGTTETKAGQLFKDMIAVGLTCPMMAPDDCFKQAMITSAGPEAFAKARFYVTFGGVPPEKLTGAGAEFARRYAVQYGGPPKEAYAAYGYDAARVALEAVRRAGKKDRDAVRRAGLTLPPGAVEGTTGPIRFDANGDTVSTTMSGNTVEDGEFRFVRLLELPSK